MAADELIDYYARRAREYERIYEKPERQRDLRRLRDWLRSTLADHDILEIACGTGYWTECLAPVARSIVATDVSPDTLALARRKSYPRRNVRFALADAHDLIGIDGTFTAALAAFWWSHVRHGHQDEFLRGLGRRLGNGRLVVLVDNRYVAGSSTPVSRRDAAGNTFQQRRLSDGSVHEVLKNFPTADELHAAVAPHGEARALWELEYYWVLTYRVRNRD